MSCSPPPSREPAMVIPVEECPAKTLFYVLVLKYVPPEMLGSASEKGNLTVTGILAAYKPIKVYRGRNYFLVKLLCIIWVYDNLNHNPLKPDSPPA